MLFNSIDFAVFLPMVFLLYWFVFDRSIRLQNLFIVAASYLFYGLWDWRFLSLIIISTVADYTVGRKIATAGGHNRRVLLWTSILVNLGILGFFKYYNFFAVNFASAFRLLGAEIDPFTLSVVLPVGISFYTFQTLSYTIDVYNGRMPPAKDFVTFAAYVSFFPQLVAGPIERATQLVPQFQRPRRFDGAAATDGMRQILWGLFKKVVIADNCAEFVNYTFENNDTLNGSTLLVGAVLFAFQIYGDFSGYSDIAIGTARLFGFELMRNFAYPYFSRDIAEFWRRWHISLSTWFRDYLYIPLGGSRVGKLLNVRNIFIIFIVSGFWHGAAWTFIIWGALNALYFLPLLLADRNRRNIDTVAQDGWLPSMRDLGAMLATFGLTVLAWIFFRATSVSQAINYIAEICSSTLFTIPKLPNMQRLVILLLLLMFFQIAEWLGRNDEYAIGSVRFWKFRFWRWSLYVCIVLLIYFFGNFNENIEFIYFQF